MSFQRLSTDFDSLPLEVMSNNHGKHQRSAFALWNSNLMERDGCSHCDNSFGEIS